MLVVDFMHEFELGVWRTLFKHLIRILYAAAPGGRLVAEFDERYEDKSLTPVLNTHLFQVSLHTSVRPNHKKIHQ